MENNHEKTPESQSPEKINQPETAAPAHMIGLDQLRKFGLPGIAIFFVTVIAPFIGPEIRDFYRMVRGEDRADKEIAVAFTERQLVRLEAQVERLGNEVIHLSAQIAILTDQRRIDRAAFTAAPVAIWTLDWNGHHAQLDDFNPAFERLIFIPEGVNPDVARGKQWSDLFSESQAKAYTSDDMKVFRTRTPSVSNNLYTLRRNGEKQYWQVTKWPIILDGKLVGLRGIAVPVDTLKY